VKKLLRKVLFGVMAAATLAVATGVLVVAAAYALFALVAPSLGPAGGAGVVALAAAVLIGLTSLVFTLLAQDSERAKTPPESDLLHKLMTLARERPIVSTGALIGALTVAIRNPALIAIVMKTLLDPKVRSPSKKSKL
jgi:hypothetical protein